MNRTEDLRNDDREWSGFLTMENAKEIYERILRIFVGHLYTWVEVYEYRNYRPVTRIHQELKGYPYYEKDHKGVISFGVQDTWGPFGLSVAVTDKDIKNGARSEGIVFTHNDGHHQLIVNGITMAGKQFSWTLVRED